MPTRSQIGKTIHDDALADIKNADAKTVIAALSKNDLTELLHWCEKTTAPTTSAGPPRSSARRP